MLLREIYSTARRFATTGNTTNVIVVGGGHAGCEAATAAVRCGVSTILLTHKVDSIGEMSCNPSFGGIGKGHLIREIDALDGVCGRICDQSAITYQALNRGAGAAVLGLRAQIDRKLYKKNMQEEILNKTPNLRVMEGAVEDLSYMEKDGKVVTTGVILSNGEKLQADAVVITTGTFLGGEIFLGTKRWTAGRIGDKSSIGLTKTFKKLGLQLGRLRTGTPPRLIKNTIDFSQFQTMPPDEEPIPFSFLTENIAISVQDQLPTYLGYTNESVADIVRTHLHRNEHVKSETTGPRYCPSLESKVIRFPNLQHRLFLEHEGLHSDVIYPQGMSMTCEETAQLEIMRSIPGLKKVDIAQPGYGVQYDFVNPKQLKPTLELKSVDGLFLAGQINGTTGYEEAASQGVLAGINAAARVKRMDGMTIKRTQAYLGVLVDDLTSLGTNEPYRMFTSRAECRLYLRPDNADIRLTEAGNKLGAISDKRWAYYETLKDSINEVTERLKSTSMSLTKWAAVIQRLDNSKSRKKVLSAYEMVYRYSLTFDELATALPNFQDLRHQKKVEERIRIEGSYALQHERMRNQILEIERESTTMIPEDVSYEKMIGMSDECAEKLDRMRPGTLAAATRIPGITPEAIIVLLRYLKRDTAISL